MRVSSGLVSSGVEIMQAGQRSSTSPPTFMPHHAGLRLHATLDSTEEMTSTPITSVDAGQVDDVDGAPFSHTLSTAYAEHGRHSRAERTQHDSHHEKDRWAASTSTAGQSGGQTDANLNLVPTTIQPLTRGTSSELRKRKYGSDDEDTAAESTSKLHSHIVAERELPQAKMSGARTRIEDLIDASPPARYASHDWPARSTEYRYPSDSASSVSAEDAADSFDPHSNVYRARRPVSGASATSSTARQISPSATEELTPEETAKRRRKNTEAARRSRQKKKEHVTLLEEKANRLEAEKIKLQVERDFWRERAMKLMEQGEGDASRSERERRGSRDRRTSPG